LKTMAVPNLPHIHLETQDPNAERASARRRSPERAARLVTTTERSEVGAIDAGVASRIVWHYLLRSRG